MAAGQAVFSLKKIKLLSAAVVISTSRAKGEVSRNLLKLFNTSNKR